MNFASQFKITKVAASTADGTTQVNGTGVDMSGWEGVLFLATVATGAADNKMHAAQDVASGGTYTDLSGSAVAVATDGDTAVVEVYKPSKRYVRPEFVRGTSTVLGEIYAIQYSGRKIPPTQPTATKSVFVLEPAEGTP